MIEIVPAIDIIEGRCVRLTKGEFDSRRVYDTPVEEMARRYEDCGVKRIHIVDLDGARLSRPSNLHILEDLTIQVGLEIEWGGGIGSDYDLQSVFDAGADYAIIGSVAAREPDTFEKWLEEYGERMILGADVKDGKIAVKGWTDTVESDIDSLVERFAADGLKECIVTDISRDGMLQGPSTQLYTRLQATFPDVGFTVSGGISGMDDIRQLDSLGLRKVIVGKAIYEGRITLNQIAQWSQNA